MSQKVLANLSGISEEAVQRAFRQIERAINEVSEGLADTQEAVSDVVGGSTAVTSVTSASGALTASPVVGDVVLTLDLSGYSLAGHTHPESDITGLIADLAGKAPLVHTHAESDITGLVADLAARPTGSGTAGRSTRWTGASVLGTGAFLDDGTNASIAGTLTLTPMTAGSVLFAGAAGVVAQDNANLFWDDSNNRLGIGTNSPPNALTVVGSAATTLVTVKNTNAAGYSAWDFLNNSGASTMGFGHTNTEALNYLSLNGVDLKITSTGNIQRVKFFNSTGNVNIGPDTSDPGRLFRLKADKAGSHLFDIHNTSATGFSAVSFYDSGGIERMGFGYETATSRAYLALNNGTTSLNVRSLGQTNFVLNGDADGSGNPGYTGYVVAKGSGSPTELWYIGRDGTGNTDGLIFRRASSADDMKIDTSGNVSITNNLSVLGGAALGNASGDAHTLLGTLNLNATAGSNGQIAQIVSGVPKWGAASTAGLVTGSGTANTLAMFTGTNAVGDSPVVYNGSTTLSATKKLALSAVVNVDGLTVTNSLTTNAGATNHAKLIKVDGSVLGYASGADPVAYGVYANMGTGTGGSPGYMLGTGLYRKVAIYGTAANADEGFAGVFDYGDVYVASTLRIGGANGVKAKADNGTEKLVVGSTATGVTGNYNAIAAATPSSMNTAGADLFAVALSGEGTSSKSAGSNTLTNIGVLGTAANGDVNYSGYFDAGNFQVNGAATLASTLAVSGNATLGDAPGTDQHIVNGYLSGSRTFSAATANSDSLLYQTSGTFATTGGNIDSWTVRAVNSATRSAGANALTNWGVRGEATGGQQSVGVGGVATGIGASDVTYAIFASASGGAADNFSFYGAAGRLWQAGAGAFGGDLTVGSDVTVHATSGIIDAKSVGLFGAASVGYSLDVTRGPSLTAAAKFTGTSDSVYFMLGANENVHIRPGTAAGTVYVGDNGNAGVSIGGASTPTTVNGALSVSAGAGAVSLDGGQVTLAIGGSAWVDLTGGAVNLNRNVIVGDTTARTVGFYGSAGTAKPTVTGSRGGNAALASLLTALANLGLIVNSTT